MGELPNSCGQYEFYQVFPPALTMIITVFSVFSFKLFQLIKPEMKQRLAWAFD